MYYAQVIVAQKIADTLWWSVPTILEDDIEQGAVVLVDVKGKKLVGIVFFITQDSPPFSVKPIQKVYDKTQMFVHWQQLRLWEWMASYYLCTLGEMMMLAYPSFMYPLEPIYCVHTKISEAEISLLRYEEELMLRYIIQKKNGISLSQLEKKIDIKSHAIHLHALLEKGYCTEKKIRPSLKTHSTLSTVAETYSLTDAQQQAFNAINCIYETGKQVVLLHGVTGAGKTYVYAKKIQHILDEGKQILFLLPEIVLADQMFYRLEKWFGSHIARYHSALTHRQRINTWKRLSAKTPIVVIGTMSAVFLPLVNLGLVICDEEHDPSYKQNVAPFYHARDVALVLASFYKAPVLLGSATPSLESYHHSQSSKYGLVSLTERHKHIKLPEINIFNLRTFLGKKKPELWIANPVKKDIDEALNDKQQVLIFQNRRGYAPYTICTACQYILTCRDCNAHLVYYKGNNQFKCHYCSTTYQISHCHQCLGVDTLVHKKAGTQRVEEMLKLYYPHQEIFVLDSDIGKQKKKVEHSLKRYKQGESSILLGTQIVSKGFDFRALHLVVVPDFDSLLQFHDFRNNERIIQQMEQVGGRAGRNQAQGKVWIQTNNIHYPLLPFICNHDYIGFIEMEMQLRQKFLYPPFCRLIYLICKSKNLIAVQNAAQHWANLLQSHAQGIKVYGPSEPAVAKIRNEYLRRIILKCDTNHKIYNTQKQCVINLLNQYQVKGVTCSIQVDPI